MDETGTSLKVIAEKGVNNVPWRTRAIRTHVTIVACVNSVGERMSTLLVVKCKIERSVFCFITAETRTMVQRNLSSTDRPQILILDGHSSHESLALIQEWIGENVAILSLPPHTSHYLQPWTELCLVHSTNSTTERVQNFCRKTFLHKFDKWTFPTLFKTAWHASMTAENIKSGFHGCGMIPFSQLAIHKWAVRKN